MNTFWLKIAMVVFLVLGVIVLVTFLTSGTPQPDKPEKTFYDQAEEDKEKFLAEPEALDIQESPVDAKSEQVSAKPERIESGPPTPVPAEPPQPTILYFKPLSEIDNIEAERLLSVAVPGRSIGRLPMTGFKLMVDNCRQIIRRWPDSWFAFRAKQMLADMPERYHTQHHVTEKDLDISRFEQQRPGTKPYEVEIHK